jgi:hypothetical protein
LRIRISEDIAPSEFDFMPDETPISRRPIQPALRPSELAASQSANQYEFSGHVGSHTRALYFHFFKVNNYYLPYLLVFLGRRTAALTADGDRTPEPGRTLRWFTLSRQTGRRK